MYFVRFYNYFFLRQLHGFYHSSGYIPAMNAKPTVPGPAPIDARRDQRSRVPSPEIMEEPLDVIPELPVDPLGPDNKLIFAPGPMTGTFAPSSGRYNVVTKGPLTGTIAASNSGGTFGPELKFAGYD